MSTFSTEFAPYGPGELAPIRGLSDATLLSRLRWYKRAVGKRYDIVKPPHLGRDLRGDKHWISKKIDGQLWFLVKRHGEVAAVAYNGRVLRGVPVTDEASKLLEGVEDCVIPGELFAVLSSDTRPTCHHIAKALGDGELASRLAFKAFDILEIDGEDWFAKPYALRFDRLGELFDGGKRAAVVTTVVGTATDAVDLYQEWVASKKTEGLVIRNESRVTAKCKPAVSLDLVVVAFGERRAPDHHQVRDVTVAVVRDDGSLHIAGTVGGGFSDEERLDWFERLSAMEVPSSFRLANREGTLCRFVRPELAIEVKVSDLLAFEADDRPVRKMALAYDAETGYTPIGQMPTLSLVHPTFIRIRDDKTVDRDNTGVAQLWNVVPFDQPHDDAVQESLPVASVIDRGVYTKASRGKTMVRKYVAIETNKHDADPRHPAFVVHFTDFSPNRAEALKTSLKVSATADAQSRQVEAWIAANIKAGWVQHEA